MNKHPYLSIILPTYNRGFILGRAVKSVIDQSFKDWELLIIDDGSTDDTPQVIRPFLKSDRRIRYFKQKNLGHVKARQRGIRFARGKIITFIDSDDYYEPGHLQKNTGFLNKNPGIDMILSNAKIIGNKYVRDITEPAKLIHIDKCSLYATFFIKKNIFEKIKKLPPSEIGPDYLLHQLIIKKGFNTKKTRLRTYVYDRTHKDSITNNFDRFR